MRFTKYITVLKQILFYNNGFNTDHCYCYYQSLYYFICLYNRSFSLLLSVLNIKAKQKRKL